jgi:hypothetical protein
LGCRFDPVEIDGVLAAFCSLQMWFIGISFD